MKVRNKLESDRIIRQLNLNVVEYKIFNTKDFAEEQLKTAMQAYMLSKGNECTLWNIRDRSKSCGKFIRNITVQDLSSIDTTGYKEIKLFQSMDTHDKNDLVMQGDIYVDREFNVLATISTEKGLTLRESTGDSKLFRTITYNDCFDKAPVKFRDELNYVVEYIAKNELFNVYAEFTLYKVPVGSRKERIIIWELRNY